MVWHFLYNSSRCATLYYKLINLQPSTTTNFISPSTPATCFGRTDRPRALNIMYLMNGLKGYSKLVVVDGCKLINFIRHKYSSLYSTNTQIIKNIAQ